MSLQLILIVDDNEDSRIVFSVILQRAGFLTIVGRDGLEGLHLARTHRPDAVVADLHLPKLDGRGLIAGLRSHPRTASIPALLITADSSAGPSPGFGLDGQTEIVFKPCTPRELMDAVERCLAPGHSSRVKAPEASDAGSGVDDSRMRSTQGGSPCESH